MRKRQRTSTFCYFLLFFAQFFGLIEQQQNSPLSRHFFVVRIKNIFPFFKLISAGETTSSPTIEAVKLKF
jgi:hypothetical protein